MAMPSNTVPGPKSPIVLPQKKGIFTKVSETDKALKKKTIRFHYKDGTKGEGDGVFPDVYVFINLYAVITSLILAGVAYSMASLASWLGGSWTEPAQIEAWMAVAVSLGYLVLNCIKIEGRPDLERIRKILSLIFLIISVVLIADAVWKCIGGGLFPSFGSGPAGALAVVASALGAVGGAVVAVSRFVGTVAGDVANIIAGDEDRDGIPNIADPDFWGSRLYNENPQNLRAIRTGVNFYIPIGNGYLSVTPLGGIGFIASYPLVMRSLYRVVVKRFLQDNMVIISRRLIDLKSAKLSKFADALDEVGIARTSKQGGRLIAKYSDFLDNELGKSLVNSRKLLLKNADEYAGWTKYKFGSRGKRYVNILSRDPRALKGIQEGSVQEEQVIRNVIRNLDESDARFLSKGRFLEQARTLGVTAKPSQRVVGELSVTGSVLKNVDPKSVVIISNAKGGARAGILTDEGVVLLSRKINSIEDASGNMIIGKSGTKLILKGSTKIQEVSLLADGKTLSKGIDASMGITEVSKSGLKMFRSVDQIDPSLFKLRYTDDVGDWATARQLSKIEGFGDFDASWFKGFMRIGHLDDLGELASIAKVAGKAGNRRRRY